MKETQMNLEGVKLDLVKMIKDKGGVSFVEIENYFEEINFDYRGEEQLNPSGNNKIIYWCDWNEQACNLIIELLKDDLIEISPAIPLIYIIDGKGLDLPIYNEDKPYPQWLPVEFN